MNGLLVSAGSLEVRIYPSKFAAKVIQCVPEMASNPPVFEAEAHCTVSKCFKQFFILFYHLIIKKLIGIDPYYYSSGW